MSTFQQLTKKNRSPLVRKTRRVALMSSPQKTADLLKKIIEVTPRKPNSAKRKIAWAKVNKDKNGRAFFKIFAYLPGNGTFMKVLHVGGYKGIYQNLTENSKVLVRGGRTKDVPGLKYKMVFCPKAKRSSATKSRVYALKPIVIYNQKRSKYGVKFGVEERNSSGVIMPYFYSPNQLPKKKAKQNEAVLEAIGKQRCFERDLYNSRKLFKNFNYSY